MNDRDEPKVEVDRSELADILAALGGLDEIIHQRVRLALMSLLVSLGELDFTQLRDLMSLSDGNLATHLALLEEKGYVVSVKTFVKRKPRTRYSTTATGQQAFRDYVGRLEILLGIAPANTDASPLSSVIPLREIRT